MIDFRFSFLMYVFSAVNFILFDLRKVTESWGEKTF